MKFLRKLYERLTRDRWEIGFVDGGLDAVMGQAPLKVNWLQHGYKDRWFADPFILDVTDSEIQVLVEEYRYETKKGRIALLVVDKRTYRLKSLDIVLEAETHLSFPAIWREKGKVFVYPENWQSGSLSIYELKDGRCDPDTKRMLCEEAMADAIMTERFGKRMLFSVCDNDKLKIYNYVDEKQFFALSIVKRFKKATARNGGDFFEYQGEIFRPAQVCVDHYGEALEIQKVIYVGPGNFCLIPYKTIHSPHSTLRSGLHTLNSFKDVVVIDVHGWKHRWIVSIIHLIRRILYCRWLL